MLRALCEALRLISSASIALVGAAAAAATFAATLAVLLAPLLPLTFLPSRTNVRRTEWNGAVV